MTEKLQVDIGRELLLKNPVMTASGTFGYGSEYNEFVDLNQLGGIIVKGLSLKPSKGNPPPRIVETPGGMLNAIGLENVGIDAFISEGYCLWCRPCLRPSGCPGCKETNPQACYGETVAKCHRYC
jgi:dihydroorotate dehydrogenase